MGGRQASAHYIMGGINLIPRQPSARKNPCAGYHNILVSDENIPGIQI